MRIAGTCTSSAGSRRCDATHTKLRNHPIIGTLSNRCNQHGVNAMTSLKLVGAAAIAASTLAGPAMGQSSITNPAACESMFASANCLNAGAGSPYATSRQERQYRRTAYRQQNRNDS